jgi:hypothetical protein
MPVDVFSAATLTSPLSNVTWSWTGQGQPNVSYALPLSNIGSTYLLLGTPQDSDGDGLTDAYEQLVSHSNPYVSNSIDPSMLDGWAVLEELNPFGIYDRKNVPTAPRVRLGYWRFNGSFSNENGQAPLAAQSSLVPDWSGSAAAMTNTDGSSQLIFPYTETNGWNDFSVSNGTIRFWFKPNWTTGDTNTPAPNGTFFLVGYTSSGSWGMSLLNNGTNTGSLLQFHTTSNNFVQSYSFQTAGNNGAVVHFRSNIWCQIALTYSPSNIALYTNGILVATGNTPPMSNYSAPVYSAGNGIAFYPPAPSQATGFNFGSQPGQPTAIRGELDELESFNYPLSPQAVAAGFPTFAGATNNIMQDSDYDGRSDLLETLVDGTNPHDPNNVIHCRLGYWQFDAANLMAGQGQLPLSANGATLTSSWSGTALNISSNPSSHVTYWDVFTNGWANINCRQGCVRFWFKPNWTGAPPAAAPFVYVGNPNPSASQWSLGVNTSGEITFVTASNGLATTHLTSAPLPFDAGHWMQIALNYGPTGSSLYVNGALATTGSPVASWPPLADRNLGMVIGNTTAYNNSVNGQFDEMETFNYQLDPTNILSNFQTVQAVDGDLNGIPDLLEDIVLPVGKPFLNAPVVITGTIEAEQFDMGGPGIGYFNVASNAPCSYRPTGMFITNCDDLGLGYCLDQTRAGDWMQYTINVLVPQAYNVETRVQGIGTNGVFDCEFVNNNLRASTGPLTIASTNWTNISGPVWLTNGIYTMKLRCLTNGTDGVHVGRFNYISIYPWWQAGFATGYTNVISGSALSTNADWFDATNNAAIIQEAVNTLPAGGGTVLLPSGTYYLSQASPNETNSSAQNTAVLILTNNVEIAGAGKSNTTLVAFNRATTLFSVGRGYGTGYTNFTLRDMTLQGQPHRAVYNVTNTAQELGQLLPTNGFYTGFLTMFTGASTNQLTCNTLITNCKFLYSDVAIGIVYYVSNCLIIHCDFTMWGGSNTYTGLANGYPTNTLNTYPLIGGEGIFCSAAPDFNVAIVENTYNGNSNLAPSTNNPFGYVNSTEDQVTSQGGFVWLQGGGNYFIARNNILNYSLEGVQLNAGPSTVVGNSFNTVVNNDSCCALSLNAGEFGVLGSNPLTFSTCLIGNQVLGGRHAFAKQTEGITSVNALTISGNVANVYPALPALSSYPGDVAVIHNCANASILGNTLVAGGHGVSFDFNNGNALVMNNNFASASYRGIGLAGGGGSVGRAVIIGNMLGKGSTFHVQLPFTNSSGWFLYKNTYLDALSNSVPPFIDPAGSAVHVNE